VGREAELEAELKASMGRVARNLSPLVEGRDLSPVFMEEVHAAAEEGELRRFFDAVAYLLAALGEASPQRREDGF
jgi:hypothetical protein